MKRLTAQERAEIFNALKLREALCDKRLCARYGINRKTLWRLRMELLNAPREMSPNVAPGRGRA